MTGSGSCPGDFSLQLDMGGNSGPVGLHHQNDFSLGSFAVTDLHSGDVVTVGTAVMLANINAPLPQGASNAYLFELSGVTYWVPGQH